jgi:SAM-dependent methyltransferase
MGAACFICGGRTFDARTPVYRRCVACGHETLTGGQAQGYIVNDPLSERDAKRWTGLDRFKRNILHRFDPHPPAGAQWVDVGSASGKYLYQNRDRYARAVGLEITPEALAFSRNVLGLNVLEHVAEIPMGTHIATAWHSLEHFPVEALENVLGTLARGMSAGAHFVVSVPNAASRQYRWFGSAFAYFDVPHHLHQFSPQSLDRLLSRFGFTRIATVSSWPYNAFGYTQGLLNIITRTHNYLYYRLKRRSLRPSLWLDLAHVALLPVLVPLGWGLAMVDALRSESQGVITACYEKNRS